MISLKKILSEATLTEKKYYVTYNKGRGQGKDLEKEFDQKTFKTTTFTSSSSVSLSFYKCFF